MMVSLSDSFTVERNRFNVKHATIHDRDHMRRPAPTSDQIQGKKKKKTYVEL